MSFGRLERKQGSAPMSEINVTPLVDVMLVLVVIFMITAPLMTSSIRLDLPRASAATPTDTPQFISLGVDKSGQVFWGDQPIAPEALAKRLTQTAAEQPDTEIQLRADTSVPYGRVVAVMDLAQKAGLNRIGFVAEPKP